VPLTPAQAERNKLQMRAKYAYRRANRLCLYCAAGLQAIDTQLCVECSEKRAAADKRYRRKMNPRRRRKQQREWRAARRDEVNAKRRDYRMDRKSRGLCVTCNTPALDDSVYCERHREATRENARNSWRRRFGSDEIRALAKRKRPSNWVRPRPSLDQPYPYRGSRVVPTDVLDPMEHWESRSMRLLRAAQFQGWTTGEELIAVAGGPAPAVDRLENQCWAQDASRLYRDGSFEHRKPSVGPVEHRITTLGRQRVRDAMLATQHNHTRRAA